MRRAAALLALLALPLLLAACGGGEEPAPRAQTAPPARTAPPSTTTPGRPSSPLATPPGVPQAATGPASADGRATVRRWLAALSRGDVRAAARTWALPARFQNGTPVLDVESPAERLAINQALPCGGRIAEIGGAGRFTVVTIRLTQRPGADCGGGVGGRVRSTLLVRDGRIRALYRLYEPGEDPGAPTGPVTPV